MADENLQAAAGARAWHDLPLAVLDTETTGLAPESGDCVIEVAVIHFDGGEITDRWSTLLDPGIELHPDVTRITGITPDDLLNQPRFKDVADELLRRLRGRVLVAYNAPFDRNFLIHEFSRVGKTLPEGAKWLDPLVIARQTQKGQGNMKLGTVAKRLAVQLDEAHRAEADAVCAGQVLLALGKTANLPDDLDAVLDLQERWEAAQEAERAGWRSRQAQQGRTGNRQLVDDGSPRNALGAAYPHGDELDPVRYMYLRLAGRG
jgi:DNA polymerase-3 subunit epsilon